MLIRDRYFNKLLKHRDKHIIKVITGIRRAGKSVLLRQFGEYLQENGVKESNIIFINFEHIKNQNLMEYHALHEFILRNVNEVDKYYIFLDEIQLVPEFQKAVNSLFLYENLDIYITGSNAYMLSGELATLLSGRYVEIKVMPFSFAEYIAWTGLEKHEAWNRYFTWGGLPYISKIDDEDERIDYLSGIYNTVLLKDIVSRNQIRDVVMLEAVAKLMFDSIGNPISAKKITGTMVSTGRKIASSTVEGFVKSLQDALLLYKAERYDIKGKMYLKTLGKYYAADMGLRQLLIGSRYKDYGHILENIVYLELIRRGYRVYVGKLDTLEIDFVAEKSGILEYYQVSMTLIDEATYEREIKPLKKIKNDYHKFILTLDEIPANDDGIEILNVRDWLLNSK